MDSGEAVSSIKEEYQICSLYKHCLWYISDLLLETHYKVPLSPVNNPFSSIHPNILQDLIRSVCEKTTEEEECLKSSYVYPLITTGKITTFVLSFAYILQKDAEEILNDLQPYSEKLKSLKLSYQKLQDSLLANSRWTSSNLGTLLRSAKNLVCLQSCINFNPSELFHCKNLEKLTLNFAIADRLRFLRSDNKIHYNYSLKILRILNTQENKGLYLDIAEILHHCINITEIDYDVSQCLVNLHRKKKARQYKLQKALLGNHLYPLRASAQAILIASMCCPNLRTVDASPSDYTAFRALSKFQNITNLTIRDADHPFQDFNQAIRPLLENSPFCPNLKSLVLRYFSDLDFSCIGACCPKLEELTVEYISEKNQSEFTTNSFKNVISLFFKNIMKEPCKADSIVALLCKPKGLEFLTIDDASSLNDALMDSILKDAEFSKVRYLTIGNSGLTELGLEKLAQSMTSLHSYWYTSKLMSSEDIDKIFRKHRPDIQVNFFKEEGDEEEEEGCAYGDSDSDFG